MPNRSYRIGYQFERRCRLNLESNGYVVIRSGKSKFPDGIACSSTSVVLPKAFYYECKVNKFLKKVEKDKVETIKLKTGLPFLVFYREKNKIRRYEV